MVSSSVFCATSVVRRDSNFPIWALTKQLTKCEKFKIHSFPISIIIIIKHRQPTNNRNLVMEERARATYRQMRTTTAPHRGTDLHQINAVCSAGAIIMLLRIARRFSCLSALGLADQACCKTRPNGTNCRCCRASCCICTTVRPWSSCWSLWP